MLRFTLKRLGFMAISLVCVALITFILMQLAPGKFLDIQILSSSLQTDVTTSQETINLWEERYGLNQPLHIQFLRFLKGMVTLDLGPSFQYPSLDVEEIIQKAFPVSVTLAVVSVVVALLIAVPLGILAAVKQNGFWDYVAMFVSMVGNAIPAYVLAVFLMLLFTLKLRLLPSGGWTELKHLVLPVLALSLTTVAGIARYMRSSMVETLRADYIAAAWAKGGSFRTVVLGHALRNSLIPLVTVVGPMLARLMVGTVFIESMFRIPGLGQYFAQAASNRDLPLLMASTVFFAFVIMTMNLIVDLLYGVLDPRIRYD